jgi:hypothetical protein
MVGVQLNRTRFMEGKTNKLNSAREMKTETRIIERGDDN